jgi:hypothetical protein
VFTLVCDFRNMSGVASTRITSVTVRASQQIGEADYVYERETIYPVVGGYLELELPDSADPDGYYFTVTAAQQGLFWYVLPQAFGTSVNLSSFPVGVAGSVGDGSGIVPLSSANSGTAYTVTAPTRGEKRLKLNLTGNCTLTLSGGTAGEVCAVQLHLIQDATGSRTVTWPGNIQWGLNGAPTLSTVTGKTDIVYLTTDDGGSTWQGALVGNGFTSPAAPSAPVLTVGTFSGDDVVLTWTQGAANGSTVTQNKIYKGTVSGSLTLLATIAANTTYTDTSTTAGGTYFYKVSAVNIIGEGTQSNEIAPSTVIASDTFTAADSATGLWNGTTSQRSTPVGSKAWTGDGVANWGISTNRAYKPASSESFCTIQASDADVSVLCDYTIGATRNDSGLVVRYVDNNNHIKIFADPAGWYIQKKVAGVTTNVNNAGTVAAATTYSLKVVCNGSSIQVYVGGVLTVSGTVSDGAILGATKHGIYSFAATDHFWDNFAVTNP